MAGWITHFASPRSRRSTRHAGELLDFPGRIWPASSHGRLPGNCEGVAPRSLHPAHQPANVTAHSRKQLQGPQLRPTARPPQGEHRCSAGSARPWPTRPKGNPRYDPVRKQRRAERDVSPGRRHCSMGRLWPGRLRGRSVRVREPRTSGANSPEREANERKITLARAPDGWSAK